MLLTLGLLKFKLLWSDLTAVNTKYTIYLQSAWLHLIQRYGRTHARQYVQDHTCRGRNTLTAVLPNVSSLWLSGADDQNSIISTLSFTEALCWFFSANYWHFLFPQKGYTDLWMTLVWWCWQSERPWGTRHTQFIHSLQRFWLLTAAKK